MNKSFILYLETKEINKFKIALINNQKIDQIIINCKKSKLSSVLLKSIDKMLKNQQIGFQHLKAIAVYTSAGSFTSLRVGVTTANVLAWSLNIPVISIKKTLKNLSSVINNKKIAKHFYRPVNISYQQLK